MTQIGLQLNFDCARLDGGNGGSTAARVGAVAATFLLSKSKSFRREAPVNVQPAAGPGCSARRSVAA
jgi:hypothetical protein